MPGIRDRREDLLTPVHLHRDERVTREVEGGDAAVEALHLAAVQLLHEKGHVAHHEVDEVQLERLTLREGPALHHRLLGHFHVAATPFRLAPDVGGRV